ncbi:MAG: hypothetical protein WBN83_17250 [Desulfoprunum sp.]
MAYALPATTRFPASLDMGEKRNDREEIVTPDRPAATASPLKPR